MRTGDSIRTYSPTGSAALLCTTFFTFLAYAPVSSAQSVHVIADGLTDTYTLIDSKLALPNRTVIEQPDCRHATVDAGFGRHITQEFDATLNKPVFVFHMHRNIDGDGSVNNGCNASHRSATARNQDVCQLAGLHQGVPGRDGHLSLAVQARRGFADIAQFLSRSSDQVGGRY